MGAVMVIAGPNPAGWIPECLQRRLQSYIRFVKAISMPWWITCETALVASYASAVPGNTKAVIQVQYDPNRHCIYESKLYSAGATITIDDKKKAWGHTQYQRAGQLAGALWVPVEKPMISG